MTANEVTICTCTLGDSALHLGTQLAELRRFTKRRFRQIVVDDGTADETMKCNQHKECLHNGALWLENLGPTYGCSYSWNAALEEVQTPWAFLIEDGLRPGVGWLETALDFIAKIGNRSWHGHKVGMAGFSHIQDWTLRMAGVIPSDLSTMEWWKQQGYRDFYGSDWNDGYWCWPRIAGGLLANAEELTDEPLVARKIMQNAMEIPAEIKHDENFVKDHDNYKLSTFPGKSRWPRFRSAKCDWYPGAFMLVNMDAWRAVGKFRDGCTFYEGHLGIRMGQHGYLSLAVEGPPFLHTPSLGFTAGPKVGKTPRLHLDVRDTFLADFGYDNIEAPRLANAVVSLGTQAKINAELAKVELWMDEGWEKWL
jgi:glycosyltransferase involved in cell wall biosynthesis